MDLSIQETADALGVHYMTAYRYVRLGVLPAHKEGANWRIRSTDLEQFRSLRPLVDEGGKRGTPHRRPGPARWAQRYEARVLAGDGSGAWAVLEAALASGTDPTGLYLKVISPAMVSVGRRWAEGKIDVADEHRATAITVRAVGRMGPRFTRPGRSRVSVVVGCAPGEQHSLPVSLLGDLLARAGFHVVDLGADVPAESFVHAGRGVPRLGAFGVSVTAPGLDAAASAAVTAVRTAFPGVPVLAGGGAVRDQDHARRLGADGWAPDGRAAAEVLDELVSVRR